MYDFIDIAANKKLSKLWEVIPHHFAVSIVDACHKFVASAKNIAFILPIDANV